MLLEEATFDDIMIELRGRYPDGLVIAACKPFDGAIDEEDTEPDVIVGYHKLVPSLGLAELVADLLSVKAQRRMTDRDVEEVDENEDEEA